ncbi:MAG TPA: nucleotidyltransferase domain-containing protein [Actinopolymorphaceae bacterium]|jgi:predicted nucleotidyltransferase
MPSLLASTGSQHADKVVQGVVGIFDECFPNRVSGCYLRGSYASDTQNPGSDLDLVIVFKDDLDDALERKAKALAAHAALLTPVMLEVVVVSENQLQEQDSLTLALGVKLGSRLVYGRDIRPKLPGIDIDRYTRSVVHMPYYSYRYAYVTGPDETLRYPLRFRSPHTDYRGFDRWTLPGPDGSDVPSTRLLVATTAWTATALVALRTGRYVRDKTECATLYETYVADEWTPVVVDVLRVCRGAWHYQIPPTDADRRQLRTLCTDAREFHNHYLDAYYRPYQLAELRSGEPERLLLAVRRLGEIVLPEPAVTNALQSLQNRSEHELQRALHTTLSRYAAGDARRPIATQ